MRRIIIDVRDADWMTVLAAVAPFARELHMQELGEDGPTAPPPAAARAKKLAHNGSAGGAGPYGRSSHTMTELRNIVWSRHEIDKPFRVADFVAVIGCRDKRVEQVVKELFDQGRIARVGGTKNEGYVYQKTSAAIKAVELLEAQGTT